MLDLLISFLFLTASTLGAAAFVRALPWPKQWVIVKPLGCPVCMSGWSGFAHLLVLGLTEQLVSFSWLKIALLWFALIGVAAPVFARLYPPPLDLGGSDTP